MSAAYITRVSCAVPQLWALDRQGNEIAPATGCFLRSESRVFLATNWHVASGYNPETGHALVGHQETWSLRVLGRVTSDGINSKPETFDVAVRDSSGDRLWLEHPALGRAVDVAAVDITDLLKFQLEKDVHCANDDIKHKDYIIGPGDNVFVLGYPKGISAGRNLPIWKRASIASELVPDADGLPRFLIDASTTDGMSGSPVLFRGEHYKVPNDELPFGEHGYSMGKTIQEFLGIYSGRISKLATELKNDPAAAQIGFVWSAKAVVEVLTQRAADYQRSEVDITKGGVLNSNFRAEDGDFV
jgi:hypothetical protein